MTRATLPATSTRGPIRALGAVSVSLLSIPLGLSFAGGSASAALAGAVPPPPTKALPSDLDIAPKYQEGYRCLKGDLPGPTAFAQLLNSHYGKHVYGINRTCAAEHGEGRALDWMNNAYTSDGLALGNAITRWLAAPDAEGRPGAMARRFGINYIIWNRQMWRAYDPGRGWAPYSGVSPHTDHIHLSFTWDGAYQRTSWWTGKALTSVQLTGPISGPSVPVTSTPPLTATGYPLLKRGDTHKDLMIAQGGLGIGKDGSFGPGTEAAVASFQSRNRVAVTKQLDNATWTKLVQLGLVPARNGGSTTTTSPLSAYVNTVIQRGSKGAAVVALQKALGLTADGSFGPGTETKVKAYQSSKKISPTGVVAASTWKALMGTTPTTPPTASPLAAYAKTVIQRGSTGAAVVALQKALAIGADGSFGPGTEAKVKAYQSSKGISPTGVVAASTWAALMGQSSTGTPTTSTPPPATTSPTSTEFTAYKATALRVGSKGTAVKVLQAGLGGLAVDGAFGQATAGAVKALQTRWGLPANGVVSLKTWNRLELTVHPLIGYWGTVAKEGSKGANVVALQRALRISPDGNFGPGTLVAVKAAQAQAKLASTGVVATLTWKAIESQM